jgi:hypothetical protein
VQDRRQRLDLDHDQLGGVLGKVRIVGEHGRHRLADIANALRRQDRLAERLELLDAALAEVDGSEIGDIGGGPDGVHAGQGSGGRGVDRDDPAVRMRRADHAHVQLMRKADVGGELALAADERRILQPRNRLADPSAHRPPRICTAASSTVASTVSGA